MRWTLIFLRMNAWVATVVMARCKNKYRLRWEKSPYPPRDRNSTFDPQFIKKRETILAEGVADRIIGLYALKQHTREISDWMEENLGNRVSAETISAITDRVLPEIKAWRSRSLDSVYPIVWMDAIHYKVMDDRGCAVTRAIYNVLALDGEGHKDLLGCISLKMRANFWLNVLTDLQTRGVCDILIACVDGLKGFPDAIQSVFPDTIVQLCIVHQIRNSVKYVGSKHQKEFMRDLKHVYGAVNKESAETELFNLEEKWVRNTPIVIKSWQDNWERLTGILPVYAGYTTYDLYHEYSRGDIIIKYVKSQKQGRVP